MIVLNTDRDSDNDFILIKGVVLMLLDQWLVIITRSSCNIDSNIRNLL